MERRLSAILAADVVGYAGLMERDEAGTYDRLKTHRKELFEPEIKAHHGRVFKLMGDGLLAEFASVVDAVQCAVALQRNMAARNADVTREQQIVVRIGINLGDVIIDGRDRHGEGINIAARLEQLAEPGGICVSQSVVEQLSNKLPVGFTSLGEYQVKNITKPVQVYAVQLDGQTQPTSTLRTRPLNFGKRTVAAAIAAVLIAVLVWLRPWDDGKASVARMALPLPESPSIAVLPFDYLGGDTEHAYFADGMTEDLITDLSKLSGLFVIARNSSWVYKGKPVKVQQIAEELGVRYVLEGSVRREGDQVRINAQLIDAIGGQHLWAERYDGSVSGVFALQDKVIAQIISALSVQLSNIERGGIAEVETENVKAYDAVLQGWDHMRKDNAEETLKAISLFDKATTLDPAYGRAYASLAAAQWRIVLSTWEIASGTGFEHAYEGMLVNLDKAMQHPTALGYNVQAWMLIQQGRYDEASIALDRAAALAPNDPDTHVSKARILTATGRAAEAEIEIRAAMRLDPRFAPADLRQLAISQFGQERYEEALGTLQRVVSQQSDVAEDYATIVSCLGHLGRKDGVQEAIERYNSISTAAGFDPLTVQEMGWFWYGDVFDYHPPYLQRLLDGLRKAGVEPGAGIDVGREILRELILRNAGEYDVRGATEIDVTTAKQLNERGVLFIDVRARTDYERAHILHAQSLSLPVALSRETLAAVAEPDDEIVFSCAGKFCPYSAYAAAKAIVWGYKRVYRFPGGFPAWKDAGYPIEPVPGN